MMDWEAFYNSFRKPGFISGYEIQNRLGGGAFGDVYKARKTSIGKPYAIKFLKVEDEVQREAVERELDQVRHFAAIDHPNLVSIEDMGTAMGVPFLIMGYAGEDTLARRLKTGRLEREEALLYFTQTCRGVLALHDRRLVHFDLKPSNVFLKGDVARVGDYGLSKLLVDGRMTLSFGRGTPQYMAPEILRSRADHRADIYSLGVLLFESLAGRLPYAPESEGGLVLRERDTPPEFPEDYPAPLRAATEQCLRLAPNDRFQDVGGLLEAIGQTARQGDSVRFSLEDLPAPPTAQAAEATTDPTPIPTTGVRPATGSTATGGSPGSSGELGTPVSAGEGVRATKLASNEELRQTAADLARGAVEVARGVWDGLRAGSSAGAPPGAEAEPDTSPRAYESTVFVPAVGPESEAKNGRRPRLRIRARIRGRRRSEPESRAVQVGEASPARAAGPAARQDAAERARALVAGLLTGPPGGPVGSAGSVGRRRTIPVPPRVEGGVLGAMGSSVVVAIEVLVALLGNLIRGTASALRLLTDRVARTSGGLLGRAFRLTGFLLLMVLLGFTVMLLGMVFVEAVGGRA